MTIDSDRQNVTSVSFIYIFLSFSYISLYLCCVHCQLSIYALVSFPSEECTSRGEEVRLDRFRLREKERGTDSWTNTWASRIQRREIPRHAEARVWWKKEVGGFSFLSSREPWPSSRRFLLSKSLLQIIDDSPFFLEERKESWIDEVFIFWIRVPRLLWWVYIVFNWLSRCPESEAFDEGLRGMVHYAPLANSAYQTLYPSTQIGNSLVSFLI